MDHWLKSLTGTGSRLYSIVWISITPKVSKDPIMTRPGCAHDVEAGRLIEGYLADSQVEHACYRATYAKFIELYLSREDQVNFAKSRRRTALVRKSRNQEAIQPEDLSTRLVCILQNGII